MGDEDVTSSEGETTTTEEEIHPPSIAQIVEDFVRRLESLATALPSIMLTTQSQVHAESERFSEYGKKYGTIVAQDDQMIQYSFSPPYDIRAGFLVERRERAEIAVSLLPQVFMLAMVSQYDSFICQLLKALLLHKPEIIEASERTMTFSQILEIGSVQAAREYILEKEIESVLRKSHSEQFDWMEKKFGLKLREGLESWSQFVELTERRNLFAHTNGVVSEQYLTNCRKHGVEIPEEHVRGKELAVQPEYYGAAHACVFEIGVKLAQVLWRKLVPEEIEEADNTLNYVAFSLIVSKQYARAVKLLNFGCNTLPRHSSEQVRKMMQINRAQAYKWMDEPAQMSSVLAEDDWSACGLDFKLAIAVLNDDFQSAAELMKRIGDNGSVNESDYQEWPLFQEFRRTEEFDNAYEEIFGHPFVHLEETLRESELKKQQDVLEHLKKYFESESEPEIEDDLTTA